MLGWLKRKAPAAPLIPDRDWQDAIADVALCSRLTTSQRERLRAHVARFLHEKSFSAAHELELSAPECLRIAILACLPVTGLGYEWLRGWSEVIVYPAPFRVRRHWHDEDSGVVSEADDWLSGESWQHGPLILSLDDIHADLDDPFAGYNLIVHEIAHKLDMLDGHSDGVPPLPDREHYRRWVDAFQREYAAFCRQVESDNETPLDPYAAEAPDEFFAVASEAFFSAPELLAEHHPAIHAELKAFYGVELAPRQS
jgi:hypothetical protein